MSSLMTLEADVLESEVLEADVDFGIDPVEEMRLRTWARKNYAPAEDRDLQWHPIVLDEMDRKDQELSLMAAWA